MSENNQLEAIRTGYAFEGGSLDLGAAVEAVDLSPHVGEVTGLRLESIDLPPAYRRRFALPRKAWKIGLVALAIAALVWLAARVYRVGMLMYGKRATIPEVWKWIRQS